MVVLYGVLLDNIHTVASTKLHSLG